MSRAPKQLATRVIASALLAAALAAASGCRPTRAAQAAPAQAPGEATTPAPEQAEGISQPSAEPPASDVMKIIGFLVDEGRLRCRGADCAAIEEAKQRRFHIYTEAGTQR
jgi:hypothetical protein